MMMIIVTVRVTYTVYTSSKTEGAFHSH